MGYIDSYIGEGQISYAGPGAMERGRLAIEIVAERLKITGVPCAETRGELIGVDSILGARLSGNCSAPREVRVRFVGRTDRREDAARVGNEVESLYLNGPAGGGGAAKSTREIVGIVSTLVPENRVSPGIHIQET